MANLSMQDFEIKAIQSAEHPPRIWKRFVDDTFVVQRTSDRDRFLEHINPIDQCIQFTVEHMTAYGSMPFHDALVMPEPDRSL